MYTYLIFLSVSFGASVIGAICGIGGGVLIKPILDACGVLDVASISFPAARFSPCPASAW